MMTEKTRPAGENVVILVNPAAAALPRSMDLRRFFPGNLVQRRDYTLVSAAVKSKCQNVTIPPRRWVWQKPESCLLEAFRERVPDRGFCA